MGNFFFDLIAGAFVLGIMVLLHEWGHFVAAKACGVRVDVFSIGFGPRIWGVKRGDTDYRLSALPLGGYVKMAGDNPAEERSGAPNEFLSRPRWQRFIIAVAGPAANILLTFCIFWGIFLFVGTATDKSMFEPAVVVAVPQNVEPSGVKPGDKILDVNNVPTPDWKKVYDQLAKVNPGEVLSLTVLRDGKTINLTEPVSNGPISADTLVGYSAVPPVIEDIEPGYPAEKAGLKSGDLVISINGKPVTTWPQLPEVVHASDGNPIHFVVRRDGKDVSIDVTARHTMDPNGQMTWVIGAGAKTQPVFERENLALAFKDAGGQTLYFTKQIGNIVGGLFRGRVSVRDLAGPVGIVQLSGQAAKRGSLTLLQWMAYISLDLGLLNLLPIPILDGGHVLLLVIEGTLRRDLSVAAKERFVQVGLVFLLGVFAFVMYSDILRLIQSH
jgi:regulator of sigma E protease